MRTRRRALRLAFSYLILVILSVISIYPALWVLLSSFKKGNSLYSNSLLPMPATLEHYVNLFTNTMYGTWFMNTLKVATISTILGTILVLLSSYAISRFRFSGRKQTLTLFLIMQMFPGFMAMIAIFILLNQLNLLNNHWALILVYSSGAVIGNVFIAKSYYDSIPRDIEESARVDGASHWTVFIKIMVPLTTPMLTYVSLMIFNGAFVDFIFAQLVIRTEEQRTLAVGLFDMVNRRNSTEFTMFAAGAVLIAVPITTLFVVLQRFLVQGLTAGASKG